MKITKLVHACLVIESSGKKVLVDPGVYSWQSGAVEGAMLKNIDYVLVTHAHPDHINEDFAKRIHELSPGAEWYVTPATKELLKPIDGLAIKISSNVGIIRYIESEHADLTLWGACPDHTSFVVFDEILVSGDCHTLASMHGATIFAAAINGGPWGSVKSFLNMVNAMQDKPQKVLPLHDWHWNDQARDGFYLGLESSLAKLGIEFVPLQNSVPTEV